MATLRHLQWALALCHAVSEAEASLRRPALCESHFVDVGTHTQPAIDLGQCVVSPCSSLCFTSNSQFDPAGTLLQTRQWITVPVESKPEHFH